MTPGKSTCPECGFILSTLPAGNGPITCPICENQLLVPGVAEPLLDQGTHQPLVTPAARVASGKYTCPGCDFIFPLPPPGTPATCPVCNTPVEAPGLPEPHPEPVALLPAAPLPAGSAAVAESGVAPERAYTWVVPFLVLAVFAAVVIGGTVLLLQRTGSTPVANFPAEDGTAPPIPNRYLPTSNGVGPSISQGDKLLGLEIFNPQRMEKPLDLEIASEAPSALFRLPPSEKLPPLSEPRLLASLRPSPTLTPAQLQRYNLIVDRFILYDIGRLHGREGQRALVEFQQLGPESIPALVRGVNLTVNINASCPIIVLSARLRAALSACNDPEMISYALENLGRGITYPRWPGYVDNLQNHCRQLLQVTKVDLRRRLPQMIAALDHTDPAIRAQAANSIGCLGRDAREAVPMLGKRLKDAHPEVRGMVARALVEIGPESAGVLREGLRDKEIRTLAASALGEIRPAGEELVRPLVTLLKDQDADVRLATRLALARMGEAPVTFLRVALNDPELRCEAALALGQMGELARAAIPELLQGQKNTDKQFRIATHHALVGMGKLAVPALAAAIKDADERVWYNALVALGKIGPTAGEALPALTSALEDENKSRRLLAVGALAKIDPQNQTLQAHREEVVPALAEALKHQDRAIRSWAALGLGKFGTAAQAAVPALGGAVRDPDPFVRATAAEALGRIGPEARAALPALVEALKDSEPAVRAAATTALVQAGSGAVPALRAALKGTNETARRGAIEALSRIGRPAVDELIIALRDPEPFVHQGAAQALLKIGPQARPAIPALCNSLANKDSQTRLGTVKALEQIDPAAEEALAAFTRLLADPQAEIQLAVQQALVRAGASAASYLKEALQDKNRDTRLAATSVLGRIGPPAQGAVPALLTLIRDPDPLVRLRTVQALAEINPAEPRIQKTFIECFQDADEEVRIAAELSLLKDSRKVVPLLIQALEQKAVQIRRGAVETLKKIGTEGHAATEFRKAAPALIRTLEDPDEEVRTGAGWALEQMDPRLKTALPILLQALRAPANRGQPLDPGTELCWIPTPLLIESAKGERGERVLAHLNELKKRRGERVVVALVLTATRAEAEVRPRAVTVLLEFLGAPDPPDLDEETAARRLTLYKRLAKDGFKEAAQQSFRKLVKEFPATRAAEEARGLIDA